MRLLLWMTVAVSVTTIGLLMTGVPADAHHSSAPFYDDTKSVEIQGKVTKFIYRNPHSWIYLDVTDEQSQTLEYEIELGSSVGMNRRGWTPETIKVGDIIRFTGQPSRGPGSHGMCCGELTRADGSPIGGQRGED